MTPLEAHSMNSSRLDNTDNMAKEVGANLLACAYEVIHPVVARPIDTAKDMLLSGQLGTLDGKFKVITDDELQHKLADYKQRENAGTLTPKEKEEQKAVAYLHEHFEDLRRTGNIVDGDSGISLGDLSAAARGAEPFYDKPLSKEEQEQYDRNRARGGGKLTPEEQASNVRERFINGGLDDVADVAVRILELLHPDTRGYSPSDKEVAEKTAELEKARKERDREKAAEQAYEESNKF